jgi:hypothetical protein
MNCETAKIYIDQYLNDEIRILSPELRQHLAACHNCSEYLESGAKVSDLVNRIHNYIPVLNDPSGLTDDILVAIGDQETSVKQKRRNHSLVLFKNLYFRRALSAAAIILFAVFGIEQFLVLDKINRLEGQYQQISKNRNISNDFQMYTSRETRILSIYNDIKSNNKELFEKLNTLNNNMLLLQITSARPDIQKFVTEELYRDFNKQTEFTSHLGYFIFKRKLMQKQ